MIELNPLTPGMRVLRVLFASLFAGVLLSGCGGTNATPENTTSVADDVQEPSSVDVVIETSLGDITLALNEELAPVTVGNFLSYVDSGHYDGTIFHRVIAGFMIQGGGFTDSFQQKPTAAAITNEAANGLDNNTYTIAMARTSEPHSATSQFFINVADNAFLNHSVQVPSGWGYAVFGRVTDGFDVVDQIETQATIGRGPFQSDVPVETVMIKSINRKPQ